MQNSDANHLAPLLQIDLFFVRVTGRAAFWASLATIAIWTLKAVAMSTLGTSVDEEMAGRETRRSLVMTTWTARH